MRVTGDALHCQSKTFSAIAAGWRCAAIGSAMMATGCFRTGPNRRTRPPGLAAIAMVEAEVVGDGQKSFSRRLFVSSAALTPQACAAAARAHWTIARAPQTHMKGRFFMR
jgi:predicted transposase YbfD/YdcC